MIVLKILSLYILHWFIHYKAFMYITRSIDGEEDLENKRKIASIISLIPFLATGILLYGIIIVIVIKEKGYFTKFLIFIDNIGKKQAEKDKIKSRFNILDL